MKKWMSCLSMAVTLTVLLCSSALAGWNPLTVATDGKGIAVYTASNSGRQAGILYNGADGSLSLEATNGLYSLNLTREYTVWVNKEQAEKNQPRGWQNGSINDALTDGFRCDIFLAEVIAADAPLYASPAHRHLAARHAPGTWVTVRGEFGDDYYVDTFQDQGFMPKASLRKVRDLTYRETTYPWQAMGTGEEVTVYTGGAPLPVSPSATGYSDQTPAYWMVKDGETVAMLHRLGDWVQLVDGGFIESRFLDPNGDHSRAYAAVTSDGLLDRLNVRDYADKDAGVVGKLCAGARVQVINHTDDWAAVYVTGPAGGYAFSGCVQMKFLSFGDAAAVPHGFTRVCLTRDVYSGNSGHEYRVSWGGGGENALQAGTPLTVVGVKGGFFEDDPDQFFCLTDGGRLVLIWNDGGILEPIDILGPSAKAVSNVKMRAAPDAAATVLKNLSKGDRAEVLLRGERWTLVKYKNQTGYVMSRYLKFP
ncbi:MAG: SH3 domain-containing protein [Clostridia bacterium]|nr:SH3 domain-containing protein [Clostridia bacterium]